jgi:hypothetical protein
MLPHPSICAPFISTSVASGHLQRFRVELAKGALTRRVTTVRQRSKKTNRLCDVSEVVRLGYTGIGIILILYYYYNYYNSYEYYGRK